MRARWVVDDLATTHRAEGWVVRVDRARLMQRITNERGLMWYLAPPQEDEDGPNQRVSSRDPRCNHQAKLLTSEGDGHQPGSSIHPSMWGVPMVSVERHLRRRADDPRRRQ